MVDAQRRHPRSATDIVRANNGCTGSLMRSPYHDQASSGPLESTTQMLQWTTDHSVAQYNALGFDLVRQRLHAVGRGARPNASEIGCPSPSSMRQTHGPAGANILFSVVPGEHAASSPGQNCTPWRPRRPVNIVVSICAPCVSRITPRALRD